MTTVDNTITQLKSDEEIQNEINAIAQKYNVKKVYRIAVPVGDTEETAIGYLKKPNRNTMDAAMSIAASKPLKATEILLKSCWLEGDERILNDDDTFLNASSMMDEIITIRRGEIKKN